jgi:hypothetical protein
MEEEETANHLMMESPPISKKEWKPLRPNLDGA